MRQNTQAPLRMHGRGDRRHGGRSTPTTGRRAWTSSRRDFSNFYSIGYRTTRAAADRPHSVEVAVKRKGLTVRSRKGFLEKSTETRTAEAVVASLFYPRDDNPLGISVSIGSAEALRPARTTRFPSASPFPIGKLGLVPVGRSLRGDSSSSTSWPGTPRRSSRTWPIQRQVVTVPDQGPRRGAAQGLVLRLQADRRRRAPRGSPSRSGTASPTSSRTSRRTSSSRCCRRSRSQED